MKKAYILAICVLLSLNAFSQANFYKYSVGAGAGLTRAFGDLNRSRNSVAVYGTADYYLTPFITLGVEGQAGHLKGGETDTLQRYFNNKYLAGSLNVKAHLGAVLDKGFRNTRFQEIVNGIYIGTGIGVIRNSVSGTYHRVQDSGLRWPYDQGRDRTKDAFVPVNIGIDYALKDYQGYDRFLINVNFQGNFTFGEGLDGYDDSPVYTHNQYADTYVFASVGIKYKFGLIGYHK